MLDRTMATGSLTRTQKLLVAILLGLLALAAGALVSPRNPSPLRPVATSAAAVDMFIKIDGVVGDSTDEKHKGEIAIESYSFGANQTGTRGAGAGSAGAGKASFQDLHFTMRLNTASPKLLLLCANGSHTAKAVLTVRRSGKTMQDALVITMSEVFVSSYMNGGNGAAAPLDQVSFTYSKIEFSYIPQKADGSPGVPQKAGWDLKANKGI
jgi:type VI secretion system secreted protein Hcp